MWPFKTKKTPTLPPESSAPKQDTVEQLGLLREITRKTGLVSGIQQLQLDHWIWIVLPNVKNHTIMAFPEGNDGKTLRWLEYKVEAKGDDPPDLDVRLDKLDEYVRWLLGSDMTIRVVINGKLVFDRGPK